MPNSKDPRVENLQAAKKKLHQRFSSLYNVQRQIAAGTSDISYSSSQPYQGEGRSFPYFTVDNIPAIPNDLLHWIKIQALQSRILDIDLNSNKLDPDTLLVRKEYLKEVLNSLDQDFLLLSFLITGLCWVGVKVGESRPILQVTEVYDTLWDTKASSLQDITWLATCSRFNPEADELPEILEGKVERLSTDGVVKSWVMWERDRVTYLDGQNWEILGEEENPLGEIPYIPLENLPYPRSIPPHPWIVSALALQTSISEAEIARTKILKKLAPKVVIPADMSFEVMENDVITVSDLANTPQTLEPSHAAAALAATNATLQDLRQQLIKALGVNPFAAGSAGQKISFASEVVAIQGESGLTAQYIADVYTRALERVANLVFKVGALYDRTPFAIKVWDTSVNSEILIEFNTDETPRLEEVLLPIEEIKILPTTPATDANNLNKAMGLLNIAASIQDPRLIGAALNLIAKVYDLDLETPPELGGGTEDANLQLLGEMLNGNGN